MRVLVGIGALILIIGLPAIGVWLTQMTPEQKMFFKTPFWKVTRIILVIIFAIAISILGWNIGSSIVQLF